MNTLDVAFIAPISSSAHRLAKQRCRQHRAAKAKQVYLNTLAVSAVSFYLRCMGIQTDWQASDSCNAVMQSLMNVADLSVNRGKLECLPVLPDSNIVKFPPEVWSDRTGYVAVQFEPSLTKATLLGFTPTAPASGEMPIAQLSPLDDLLEHLAQIQPEAHSVHLSQWFDNLFEAGWRSLEDLFGNQNLAFSFRSVAQETEVTRVKRLDLGQPKSKSVALLVVIAPAADQVAINVQVHPVGEEYLPPALALNLLSDTGEPLHSVYSRDRDNYIQLPRFRGTRGESFNIQVSFGGASDTETFII